MADDNVIYPGFPGELPIDPERVLRGPSGKLKKVVVIGEDADGNFWFSSTHGDAATIFSLLGRAQAVAMTFPIKGVDIEL